MWKDAFKSNTTYVYARKKLKNIIKSTKREL
jgi:hypothetical protein